ncbi:MAG TPA: TMEM175 family protein [Candidatus Acidoferrum sp.]|nr:TMEM175 family protein [Candidatus Acidoferrum sp.]
MDSVTARTKPRIESLSDLIFGLALAISTIPLISRIPAKPFGMLIDLLEFGFSFLILISVWLAYTNIMSILPIEDNIIVTLNLALLFLVSIEPYLFYLNITFDILAHELLLNYASILYALDMAGLMLILALFTHQLAREEKELVPKEALTRYKRVRDVLIISGALFAITILPFFWAFKIQGLPIRFYLWFLPLVLSSVRRVSEEQSK